MKHKWIGVLVSAAIVCTGIGVVVSGCGGSDGDGDGAGDGGSDSSVLAFLAAAWTGTWNDTRWNVNDTLAVTVSQDGVSFSGSGPIGLGAFGMSDATLTLTGTESNGTVSFTGTSSIGTISGTITNGSISGSGTVTGSLQFGAFTYSGTVSATSISITFDFTSSDGGRGTVTLTSVAT